MENPMNLETALAHARKAEAEDLRGIYPMAARVLADEVVRLRVDAEDLLDREAEMKRLDESDK